MLVFDPSKRITGTSVSISQDYSNPLFNLSLLFPDNISLFAHVCKVEEALNHPYLSSLHEINEEPTCPSPFVFDFEQISLNEEDIKELIWRESLKFNPDNMLE